jgi:NADPH:quinone reductase-like Zn-dependent oxidoreductase
MKKPSHLSWTEAAGIPEVFLTGEPRTCGHTCRCVNLFKAFQALFLLGNLKQDDNILVHAGASGVGVAAIQLARVFGALVNMNRYVYY